MIVDCSAGKVIPEGAKPTDSAKSFGCHACEYNLDNETHRCCEFIELLGTDAQGKEYNQWICSRTAMPSLLLEASSTNRSIAKAMESSRNEQIKRQDKVIKLVEEGKLSA